MTVKEFYNRMKLLNAVNANICLPSEYDIVNMTADHIGYLKEENLIILSVPDEDEDEED